MVSKASCALADCCDLLQTATHVDEFHDVAVSAARRLGYQWYGYLRLSEQSPALLSSYPSPFPKRYVDLRLCDEDPLVRHAKLVSAPFSWGDVEDADLRFSCNHRVAREAIRCGIRSGITIPIHTGFNTFASLSFAADSPAPLVPEQDTSALQLMALQFHVHFTSRADNAASPVERILTHRQQECLKWSARGKTMSEIGTILGISERTVLFHLQDARQRLDAQTITQAVAVAIHLKEIPEI